MTDRQTYRLCHNKCRTSLRCSGKNLVRGRGRGARARAIMVAAPMERFVTMTFDLLTSKLVHVWIAFFLN